MIENFTKTQITLYKATSVDEAGDITYDSGSSVMAKLEVHPVLSIGSDGATDTSSARIYVEVECPSKVLVEFDGKKHPSKAVTNFYRFGEYAFTRIELE